MAKLMSRLEAIASRLQAAKESHEILGDYEIDLSRDRSDTLLLQQREFIEHGLADTEYLLDVIDRAKLALEFYGKYDQSVVAADRGVTARIWLGRLAAETEGSDG